MADNGKNMLEPANLEEMIQNLLNVDEESFGLYAFTRDILKDRIPEGKKLEMIRKSISCGQTYARHIIDEWGTKEASFIAEKLRLKVELQDRSIMANRLLFACYTPPDIIEIMRAPVDRAVQLVRKEESIHIELFQKDSIMNTILGHEIFHYLEDQFEREIYTQTEKLLLWSFLGFKSYSTISTLSEIGAMAFTKELNGLTYSPFLLDVLLYYGFDSANAGIIYRDVLGMSSGRCRETVEDN